MITSAPAPIPAQQRLVILSCAPSHPRCLQALALLQPDDCLLLIEEGVYALSQAQHHSGPVFVFQPHSLARGVSLSALTLQQCIDFEGFVALTEQYCSILSW